MLIVEGSGVTGQFASDSSAIYLGTTTAHPLVIRTNSTEQFRVTTGGAIVQDGSAEISMSVSASGGGATDIVQVELAAGSLFACYVTAVLDQSNGYAGRTSQFLWSARANAAGRGRTVTDLSTTSIGSVNSGVVAVSTMAASASNPTGNIEKLQITPQYASVLSVHVRMVSGNATALKALVKGN